MRSSPIALALVLLSGAPVHGAISAEEEARILATIRQRTQRFMGRYKGIAERRRSVTREIADGELLETKASEQDYVHYFYSRPDLTILRCTVDGKEAERSSCESRWQRMEPHIPIFDRAGPSNYRVQVTGVVTVRGEPCYQLNVHPLHATPRHFKGKMFFRVKDLLLLEMSGTVASLPFPVRHLFLRLAFKRSKTRSGEDVVGVARGYVDVWVRVPLVFKRRIVTRFSADGHRPVR